MTGIVPPEARDICIPVILADIMDCFPEDVRRQPNKDIEALILYKQAKPKPKEENNDY